MYETLSPENITAAHGGIGANALLLMTLIEPGDHINRLPSDISAAVFHAGIHRCTG